MHLEWNGSPSHFARFGRAGYDISEIRRRGRWKSASSQLYFRDGRRVIATIGKLANATDRNKYQFLAQCETQRAHLITNAGREGGKGKGEWRKPSIDQIPRDPKERIRAISKSMSRELRRGNHPSRQRDGCAPLSNSQETRYFGALYAKQSDFRIIVRGVGGNQKIRFETGVMEDKEAAAIRESEGDIQPSGAGEHALPAEEGLGQ